MVVLSRRLPSLFERMVNLGRDVEQIGRMVTHVTDAFTVRLIQLAEQNWGRPHGLCLGCFRLPGREEQTARTDQDNGLVLEREADEDEGEYFAKLSELVCDGLDSLATFIVPVRSWRSTSNGGFPWPSGSGILTTGSMNRTRSR